MPEIFKPHHIASLVFGPQPEGVMVRWAGYDPEHDIVMQRAHERLLRLPLDTPIEFTFRADEICRACPLNISGVRFNPELARRNNRGSCNPEILSRSTEEMYIRWMKEAVNSDRITTAILPRKTYKQFEAEYLN